MQAHLRTDMFQSLRQEMRPTHPGFKRTKSMLDRLASYSHDIWVVIYAVLHRIKNAFMLPTADPAIVAGCTLGFNIALGAMRTPVTAQFQSAFYPGESPDQPLPGRTAILVGLRVVFEIRFIKPTRRLGAR